LIRAVFSQTAGGTPTGLEAKENRADPCGSSLNSLFNSAETASLNRFSAAC